METCDHFLIAYLVILNTFSFVVMGFDKKNAVNGGRRVSERGLFTLACAGGAVGIYMGMKTFRHKTRKLIFSLGMPFLVFLNAVVLYLTIY